MQRLCKPMRILLLGGSRVVIHGLISLLLWVISIVTLLITLLITIHEPPSIALNPLPLYRIPIDPFKGTLITTHKPKIL